MSKRPRIVKTTMRAASGGVIVIAALLALLFFRGPGLGQGENSSSDSDSTENTELKNQALASAENPTDTRTTSDATDSPETSEETEGAIGLTPDEQRALTDNILSILIDEHDYRMELPGTAGPVYKEAGLERLMELATQAGGDSNGIRVRILRRENSRASAEEKLKLELAHVGVRADAVYMPDEFIP